MGMLRDRVRLQFGYFYFYDHWVVCEINEGINLEKFHVDRMVDLFGEQFRDERYVVLFHRNHDHSVNPVDCSRLIHSPQVLAAGFVFRSMMSALIFQQERAFYRKPLKVFEDLEGALNWADETWMEHQKTQQSSQEPNGH
jgi:hypothetical protein